MKVLFLHLSDIHVTVSGTPVLGRHKEIGSTLVEVLPDAAALFIVLTGDLAYSGQKDEYAHLAAFLEDLLSHLRERFDKPIHVVMVPGNHDGQFKKAGNARVASIETVRERGESFVDEAIIAQCTAPQADYFEFERRFSTTGALLSDHPLWKEYRFDVGPYSVEFSAVNASWMSTVPEEPGKLVFPTKRFAKLSETEATLKIVLLHHPLNWYAQKTYHPLRDLCQTQYQVSMTGHEHVPSATLISDCCPAFAQIVSFEAGALDPEGGGTSQFSILRMDLEKKRFAKEDFTWDDTEGMYLPADGVAVWDAFNPLPQGRSNGFHITDEMAKRLENLGGTFTHPNKDSLTLSDMFVYPDLLDLDPEDETPETVSADIFAKQLDTVQQVLILGDDQFGKTSLLLHLFQQYHSIGYVPVFFDGRDLSSVSEDQFPRILAHHVTDQYGEQAVNRYAQTDIRQRVALVDNIDRTSSRGDVIARAMTVLGKHFASVLFTAGDRFDVTLLASKEASDVVSSITTYRLLGFGFKLRSELIRRWYQISSDLDLETQQQKIHDAEQLINSILGKGLVPLTAFNVLVLLQTIEIRESGTLANAGLAQYYEFLIRRSLVDAKVKNDELDEHLSYLSHLAWRMHELGKRVMQEQELSEFNASFSSEMHRTSLRQRLATLEKARILTQKDDTYTFAYSYLRYFFVAKYLAEQMEESADLKAYVVRLCRHLYLRDNANIVLFLTHHSHSRWIVQEVASVLNELLNDIKPLDLATDTGILNTWVGQKARIAVDARDVVENQKRVREQDDKVASYDEPEYTKELASIRELDQLAQLNLLFKTSEILGQILKGRYGSIKNDVKVALIKDLFDAPLRGINFFLSLVNTVPDALLAEVTKRIQNKLPNVDKDRAERAAKRFILTAVGAVSDSFLSRQGEIIGSPKLVDSIERVTRENGGVTYKLMSIAAQLSYPNKPPLDAIKDLAEQLDTNYFGYKLLQGLAARHMYMFAMPASAVHALSAAVGIDVHGQRDIELRSRTVKKLDSSATKVRHAKSLIARLHDSFLAQNETLKNMLTNRYEKKVPNKPKKD